MEATKKPSNVCFNSFHPSTNHSKSLQITTSTPPPLCTPGITPITSILWTSIIVVPHTVTDVTGNWPHVLPLIDPSSSHLTLPSPLTHPTEVIRQHKRMFTFFYEYMNPIKLSCCDLLESSLDPQRLPFPLPPKLHPCVVMWYRNLDVTMPRESECLLKWASNLSGWTVWEAC